MNHVFRRIARVELNDAVSWYESRRRGLGFELKEEVESLLARTASNPESFPCVRGQIRRALLRRFPYAIHFLIEPNRLVVLAVFHAKRDPSRLEGRQ